MMAAAHVPRRQTYHLQVEGRGDETLVSLEGQSIEVGDLLPDLLNQAEIDFLYDRCSPSGRVNLSLRAAPIDQAMAMILAGAGFSCNPKTVQGRKIFVIQDGGPEGFASDSSLKTYKQFSPQHVPVETLRQNLLVGSWQTPGIWPRGNFTGLQVGTSPESNSIFLTGPADHVKRTLQLLHAADQEVPAITLDCIFVALQESEAEELYALMTLYDGPLWLLNFGSSYNTSFSTNLLSGAGIINPIYRQPVDQNSILSYIQAGLQRIEARRTARAQITVVPGQQASVQIGRNGWLLISTLSAGQPSVFAQQQNTGTILTLTPRLLPNGLVRINSNLQFARFVTRDNLAANIFQAQFQSLVQVEVGRPILLGGLTLGQVQDSKQGYPIARKLPLPPPLNYLFEAESSSVENRHIITILVPRITSARLDSPALQTAISIPLIDSTPGVRNIRGTE